jgi:hypothetical protein
MKHARHALWRISGKTPAWAVRAVLIARSNNRLTSEEHATATLHPAYKATERLLPELFKARASTLTTKLSKAAHVI